MKFDWPWLIAIAFALFIAWVLFMADTAQPTLFMREIRHIPFGDKFGHIFLYGVLSLLLNIALRFRCYQRIYWGSLGVFVFATLEEFSQYFIPSRKFDYADFAANYIGIALFAGLSFLIARRATVINKR